LNVTKPIIKFTRDECYRGQELLDHLEITDDAKICLIHNRDSAYLEQLCHPVYSTPKYSTAQGNWSYHSDRDFDVNDLNLAIPEIINKGYYVVRMGSLQKERSRYTGSKFVDYSFSKYRSNFGDLYLSNICKFYLGSDSGIVNLPVIFRKPTSFVNFPPGLIPRYLNWKCYSLPFTMKHYFSKKEQRCLTLSEIIDLNITPNSKNYDKYQIQVINNTPQELKELSLEVIDIVEGKNTLINPFEDKFWEIIYTKFGIKKTSNNKMSISRSFFERNSYFLE